MNKNFEGAKTMALSDREKKRYLRQMMIPNWGQEGQKKLKNATVFVAGAGGLGSAVLYYLTVAGIGTIRICDFDTVEISNLNRQIVHTSDRIGMNKALSAQVTLNHVNEHVKIETITEKITTQNARLLIENADIIIDCLDNFETRHALNKAAVENNKPFIHAGIEGFRGQITFLHPPHTPCLACFIPLKIRKQTFPVVGVTAGIIGTLEALEALKFLTGIGEILKNRLLLFDGFTMEFNFIALSKNPKCKICGTNV